MPLFYLPSFPSSFPDPSWAEPDGLIAIGGDLSPERLIQAYLEGFFPWYNPGEEILWWHPDPRMVLFPNDLKVSRSMRPYFNQHKYQVSYNTAFLEVIRYCQHQPRKDQEGSWIQEDIVEAYYQLNKLGYAHSVEVWEDDQLVGGLYGVALGRVFYGESMFAQRPNASKFGFISLVRRLHEAGFILIDCQQETAHLASMGAQPIPRSEFLTYLKENRIYSQSESLIYSL